MFSGPYEGGEARGAEGKEGRTVQFKRRWFKRASIYCRITVLVRANDKPRCPSGGAECYVYNIRCRKEGSWGYKE